MVLRFDKLFTYNEQERRLDPLDLGELGKDACRHQVQLLHVRIPGILAGLVVHRVGHLLFFVDHNQVGDAMPPDVRRVELTRFQAFGEAQHHLAVLLTGDCLEAVQRFLHVRKLRGNWFTVTNVFLRNGVGRLPVQRGRGVWLDNILGDLGVVILLRTLLECLEATE